MLARAWNGGLGGEPWISPEDAVASKVDPADLGGLRNTGGEEAELDLFGILYGKLEFPTSNRPKNAG